MNKNEKNFKLFCILETFKEEQKIFGVGRFFENRSFENS
jgi:hypothetical protein